jgi:hypothetical protein
LIYTIEYKGEIVSTNELKSKSWRTIKPKIDRVKMSFWALINKAGLPKFEIIDLSVRYWSRHDVDNISATSKILVDQLVRTNHLPDDSKKYWKKISIEADETLKNNTIIFEITSITNNKESI